MKNRSHKEFYIIGDYHKRYRELDGEECEVMQPVYLYNDDSLEIEGIKKLSGGKYHIFEHCYVGIDERMTMLGNSERDLRPHFRQNRESHLYLWQVLQQIRERETIKVSELWEFWYKDQIEMCIGSAMRTVNERLANLSRRAWKRNDVEFLRKIGSNLLLIPYKPPSYE